MNLAPSDQPAGAQAPAILLDLVDAVAESDVAADDFPAWQQIDTGRYMPRRVRGSYRGGVLG